MLEYLLFTWCVSITPIHKDACFAAARQTAVQTSFAEEWSRIENAAKAKVVHAIDKNVDRTLQGGIFMLYQASVNKTFDVTIHGIKIADELHLNAHQGAFCVALKWIF